MNTTKANTPRLVTLNPTQVKLLDSLLPNWREQVGFKSKARRLDGKPKALSPFADCNFEPAVIVNFDGSCCPNPGGRPSFAWVITSPDGKEIRDGDGIADTIYPRTNNTAEFSGMFSAIHAGVCHAKGGPVLIRGDSELAINAMRKGWPMMKSPHLAELAGKCLAVAAAYPGRIAFEWVLLLLRRQLRSHPATQRRRARGEDL